jgi:acyl dehydratase
MTAVAPPIYEVIARNGAVHSDNKIHDNAVARQYGFKGGLVPGVTVHAYLCGPALDAFGPAWLEQGMIASRFLKPFYEGERVTVTSAMAGKTLELRATNGDGELCAIGSATLPEEPLAAPDLSQFPAGTRPAPRPDASEAAFRAAPHLWPVSAGFHVAQVSSFLDEIQEHRAGFTGPEAVAHPGWLIRSANFVLAENVLLGPWIHVSSDVSHLGLVHDGEIVETRANVTGVFERKGHRFVELDVLWLATGNRPVARATHTAIYEIRRSDRM